MVNTDRPTVYRSLNELKAFQYEMVSQPVTVEPSTFREFAGTLVRVLKLSPNAEEPNKPNEAAYLYLAQQYLISVGAESGVIVHYEGLCPVVMAIRITGVKR